jgi:threonine/homoserine/homoserine lactone efflux protein
LIFILAFLSGFLFATLGVLPPGLVNITAAKISVNYTIKSALKFIRGATLVVFFQTILAFYFAKFFQDNPAIVNNLKLLGSVVFVLLTLFFLGKGIQKLLQQETLEQTKITSFKNPFVYGMIISVLNVFPIPYYAFASLYTSSFTQDFFTKTNSAFFVLGVTIGSLLVFVGYAYLFKKIQHKVQFFIKNINFVLAFITALIAFFTIYNLD